jgi:glycerol-3-phosphate dehydrogenase (NAD(P)+)
LAIEGIIRTMTSSLHIIGSGAWGTALALTADRAGSLVTLHTRSQSQADQLSRSRENQRYLPGITLPDSIIITADRATLVEAHALLIAIPAQRLEELCLSLKPILPNTIPVVICSKGIEIGGDNRLLSEVVQDSLSNQLLILSGPNLAREIAQNLPAATTIAGGADVSNQIAKMLHHQHFRCYTNEDMIGVQVAGALKNVLAIACGITKGMGLGHNAVSSLLSRGLIEMRRLGVTLRAMSETFMGLAGLGDLVLTCSSELSRNFSLGVALGHGESLKSILARRVGVTEGVHTAKAVYELSGSLRLELPICEVVYRILYEDLPLMQAFEQLSTRPQTQEIY